jgi:predicted nucleic acid-binding protein
MLDTNTCIFAINGNSSIRLRFIHEYPFGLAISAITEAELWYGIENSTAP